MSQDHNHLNHATWKCKYDVVFTRKYRKKLLFGQIRRHLGSLFHELARRKECRRRDEETDPHLYQKSADGGQAVWPDAIEARV
jgi:hypothetical protein